MRSQIANLNRFALLNGRYSSISMGIEKSASHGYTICSKKSPSETRSLLSGCSVCVEWLCNTRHLFMAFKQVRQRWSLFRPWAFGDSGGTRTSEETGIPATKPVDHSESADFIKTSCERDFIHYPPTSLHGILRSEPVTLADSVFVPGPVVPAPLHPSSLTVSSPETLLNLQESLAAIHPKEQSPNQVPWVSAEIPFPVALDHLLPQSNGPKLRAKKQRPKKFQCPHCQVSFSNNGQLKGHIRIHTGKQNFEDIFEVL